MAAFESDAFCRSRNRSDFAVKSAFGTRLLMEISFLSWKLSWRTQNLKLSSWKWTELHNWNSTVERLVFIRKWRKGLLERRPNIQNVRTGKTSHNLMWMWATRKNDNPLRSKQLSWLGRSKPYAALYTFANEEGKRPVCRSAWLIFKKKKEECT